MNKQRPGKGIGWCDFTWNPVKGLCPVGCWYCYARAMYKRFKLPPEREFILNNSDYIDDYSNKLKLASGTKVFICSTFEIFHPSVKKEWRDIIFLIIEKNPDIIFQILTKMPENIDRPMPDNVWLGVSVTGEDEILDIFTLDALRDTKAKVKFVSYEPMLDWIGWPMFNFDWLIIGRLTGYGHKNDPPRYRLEKLIKEAAENNVPIFLKNNLKEIWGGKLIQEFPNASL